MLPPNPLCNHAEPSLLKNGIDKDGPSFSTLATGLASRAQHLLTEYQRGKRECESMREELNHLRNSSKDLESHLKHALSVNHEKSKEFEILRSAVDSSEQTISELQDSLTNALKLQSTTEKEHAAKAHALASRITHLEINKTTVENTLMISKTGIESLRLMVEKAELRIVELLNSQSLSRSEFEKELRIRDARIVELQAQGSSSCSDNSERVAQLAQQLELFRKQNLELKQQIRTIQKNDDGKQRGVA